MGLVSCWVVPVLATGLPVVLSPELVEDIRGRFRRGPSGARSRASPDRFVYTVSFRNNGLSRYRREPGGSIVILQ